jgi:hemolysin activation/secretion protein
LRVRWLRGAALVCVGALLVLVLQPADAQVRVRPGDERPERPEFELEETPAEPLDLPSLPEPPAPERESLSAGLQVFVRAFEIEGSTVFSDEQLTRLTAPYTGREIRSEELIEARDRITRHYIEHGYLTSGAVIPDQSTKEGVIRIQVIEGVLEGVDVEGTRRFSPAYFEHRLMRAGRAPVNVERIEEQLQRFQLEPLIERVRARLAPGAAHGQSRLTIVVEEARPYSLSASFANDEPPSIGELTGELRGRASNLLGHTDALDLRFSGGESLRDYEVYYGLPINRYDTRLGMGFRYSESEVVESPFDFLDIESDVWTANISLRQPLYRSGGHSVVGGIHGEWREARSEAKVFEPSSFCFDEGTGDCRKKVAVLRPFTEWTWASTSDVIAARAMLSLGLDAFGSTVVDSSDVLEPGVSERNIPDSEFASWLLQAQWVHRLPERLLKSEVLVRVDAQLSNSPLLSIEKFSIGGHSSVRGYRENEVVRDNGIITSLELRVPVWRTPRGRAIVEIAPFFDWGSGWDDEQSSFEDDLAGLGVGLLVAPRPWLRGEIYWGGRLKSVSNPHDAIQDEGVSFRITVDVF